jgi:hypothetical protein
MANLKFTSNTELVAVDHGTYVQVYEVFNVQGYINKCNKDGKRCVHLGRSNSNGELSEDSKMILEFFEEK